MISATGNYIRIFYLNINGIDLGSDKYYLMQLFFPLQLQKFDAICLIGTNINWNQTYLIHRFNTILNQT